MKIFKRKVLVSVASGFLVSLISFGLAYSHSRGFIDWFYYDNSNENTPAELAMKLKTYELNSSQSQISAGAITPCVNGMAGSYPCNNVDMLSFIPKANMGGGTNNTNDIWGWTDPQTGKEYAILGRTNGTSFVDVSDGVNPVYLGFLPTHGTGNSSWRDIKTYNNHAFIVADSQPTHGMQVFDLTQLRTVTTPQTFTETAHHAGFGSAHNIAINEDTGYAYTVGSNVCSGGLYMLNISTPLSPVYAGCYAGDGYTHDTQCVVYNGPDTTYVNREICFAYNEDTLTIVDVQNKTSPVQLARVPYNGARYTHQGWVTPDHRYALMNDELDEQQNGLNTTTYIWNISDLNNPVLIGSHLHNTPAIDHNLYIHNGYAYESNYRAGLRMMNACKIANGQLSEAAFFDIIPGSDDAQFSGTWSNYPFFASGIVIISDIGNGMFVLKPNITNQAPVANAGPNRNAIITATITVNGSVNDDCFAGTSVTNTWTQVSGPGVTTFGNASSAVTTATFSDVGTYTLRLTANDGLLIHTDDTVITVLTQQQNQAPVVNAGADQTINMPNSATLVGTATDDDLPDPTMVISWSKVSGPGTVTFGNAASVNTTARFSVNGTYVLQLSANDTLLTTTDNLTVVVNPAPKKKKKGALLWLNLLLPLLLLGRRRFKAKG